MLSSAEWKYLLELCDKFQLDTAAMEEFWFNNPDPCDHNETEWTDPVLQETVIQSSTWFDIANYVKLDDN